MPRPINYYESNLQPPAPTPTQTPAPTPAPAPVEQNNNQAAEKPVEVSNIQSNNYPTEKQAFWGSLLNPTYGMSVDPGATDVEKKRQLFNQIFPKQEPWAAAKKGANILATLGRETLKSPLRIQRGAQYLINKGFDVIDVGVDKLTGKKNDSYRVSSGKYSLPLLGEVKGATDPYQEGIKSGLSPFMSAVKATGEWAGDLAMSSSLVEAVGAAFQMRVKTVQKGIMGEDFRPLKAEQVKSIGQPKPGKTDISTGETINFGKAKQNTEVNYFPVTNRVAAKYGGNANNTFLKVSPQGEGVAEFSVVQLRKSWADTTKDFLASKFGKSKVVAGEMGPELKLDSGIVKYDQNVMTRMPSVKTTEAGMVQPVKSQSLENILSSIGKTSIKDVTPAQAYQFYSPNIEENLDFNTALERTKSGNQLLYKKIGQDIDQQLGYKSTPIDAIDDWSDGAENTIFNKIEKVNSYDELLYNSALKGKIGKQKSVLPFLVDAAGADSLYIADIPGVTANDLKVSLDEMGIKFKTLTNTKNGAKMIIYDEGTQMTEVINKLSEKYATNIEQHPGTGQFLGAETREGGLKVYDQIISGWEKVGDNRSYRPTGDGLSDTVSQKTKLADPYSQAKLAKKMPVTAIEKGITPSLPSVMAKPLKGFENELVTDKQASQIIGLTSEKELSDVTLQAIVKTITGKDNLYELSQTEAYDVSESIRQFSKSGDLPESDKFIITKSFTDPARYWMEAAERRLNTPVYSEIYLRMENAARIKKVFDERKIQEVRDVFGEYAKPQYAEERRIINAYTEGNKNAILGNKSLTPEVKMELSRIGDWLKDFYADFLSKINVNSKRWFEVYAPQIRKMGGIKNLYKTDEIPNEIKPFFEFERQGSFSPIEDDAMALADIYVRAVSKKMFFGDPVKDASAMMEKMDKAGLPNLKKAVNDYVQEKLGYEDKWSEVMNEFGKRLSKNTKGLLPEDIWKQTLDFFMTTSYAGALGLPRISPLPRNAIQPLLTSYPDLGPRWFAEGVKRYSEKGPQELRDKGFLVEMGVPYGAELVSEGAKGKIGKAVDFYKNLNKASMKPYGYTDTLSRGWTYYGHQARLEHYWNKFIDGKIDWNTFAKEIDLDGYNPTLQKIVTEKLKKNTPESLQEANDLMVMDTLDSTQFPYRKGTESRLHYGLKGKLGLQFSQWTWEYVYTLKSWVARGQWDKIIRWIGISAAVKKTIEENSNINVGKWMALGPVGQIPIGPLGNAAIDTLSAINNGMSDMTEEMNKNWKDVVNDLKIYGGVLSGVGTQRASKFWESIKRYEAGTAVSTDPDPDKKFGVWSTKGKLIRWVDFSELVQSLLGFESKSGTEQSQKIKAIQKENVEYQMRMDKAMNYLVEGDYKNFDKTVTDNNLIINDIAAKMKSYSVPLDQRIFDRMPLTLKDKYLQVFFPAQ